MDFDIPKSIEDEKIFFVEENHLAQFLAEENINVLSTPSMIRFMENTSRILADKYLPDGYTTVGTEINVKHLKSAPLHSEIVVKSCLTNKNGRNLKFTVSATWKDILIGEGLVGRFIINKKRMLARIRERIEEKQ
ncbi:MAG: thioesterase family protein [Candidatus Thorarchaeota archaeon]